MKKKIINLKIVILVLMLVSFSLCTERVSALGESPISMRIVYAHEDEKLSDVKISIYYVGSTDKNSNFIFSDAFGSCSINAEQGDNDKDSFAQTLYGYVLLNNIKPIAQKSTDTIGEALFTETENGLQKGIYLVKAEKTIQNGYVYTSDALTATLYESSDSTSDDTENIPNVIQPKVKKRMIADPKDEKISIAATKKWDDDNNSDLRSSSVTIKLFKDNELYDTAVLQDDNKWYHCWNNIDGSSELYIAEIPVDNYKGLINKKDSNYVIVNTLSAGSKTTSQPHDSNKQTPSVLPQTGTLWWVIPIFLSAGLFFIAVGYLLRRKGK